MTDTNGAIEPVEPTDSIDDAVLAAEADAVQVVDAEAAEVAEVEEPTGPARPERIPIPEDDEKRARLVDNVRAALAALPNYFRSETNIEGLEAGDLFSLNSVLGGTIEVQTVATLNRIREVWDPDEEWAEYGFERSSQSFPDVRLVTRAKGLPSPVLGIELKGWYLLSKEAQPSFRYTATRDASSPYDLLVVVPWRLSNILSGTPYVYEPFVEQSMYAADLRTFYWESNRGEGTVTRPEGVQPYPPAKSRISDTVTSDAGNFGRVARAHLMDEFIVEVLSRAVSGIPAKHWLSFFKTYTDNADSVTVDATVARALNVAKKPNDIERAARIADALRELGTLISGDPVK